MAAGSAKMNGVIGVIDAGLSGLQMGNPDNSASVNPDNPVNPEVITPGTPSVPHPQILLLSLTL